MHQNTPIQKSSAFKASPTMLNWFGESLPTPSAVVLVIAGMNNKPEVMHSLIDVLVQKNLPCLLLTLTGQAELPADDFDYSRQWHHEIDFAYSALRRKYPELPIYNLSYSLGATVSLAYELASVEQKFTRAVFLAPALSFTPRTYLIRALLPLRFLGISLPSLALPNYRAHNRTPLQEYLHAFSLQQHILKAVALPGGAQKLNALRTLLFMSRNDELVHFQGIADFLTQNRLNHWTLHELRPKSILDRAYEHLIIDEPSLGTASWQTLTESLSEHFLASRDLGNLVQESPPPSNEGSNNCRRN